MGLIKIILNWLKGIENQNPPNLITNERIFAPRAAEVNPNSIDAGNKSFWDGIRSIERTSGEDQVEFISSINSETAKKVDIIRKKLAESFSPGWNINSSPTLIGRINNDVFGIWRHSRVKSGISYEILTENGDNYSIYADGNSYSRGFYKESKQCKGEIVREIFETDFGFQENSSVFRARLIKAPSSQKFWINEGAGYLLSNGIPEFTAYAQPSEECLDEYSKATGLPIIKYRRYGEGIDNAMKNQGVLNPNPYTVSISVSKEGTDKEKTIAYLYTSKDAYKNGEKPFMIYMNGIDGRTKFSGIFRLKGDVYVDNSTFKRTSTGEYTFKTISYEEIMQLMKGMPNVLSERAQDALMHGFRLPSAICEIYDKANSIEIGKQPDPSVWVQ